MARILATRWPQAAVTGLDSSSEMLAAAREDDPDRTVEWVEGNIGEWSPHEPAGLIYSNAALHWIDDHDGLFIALAGALAPAGVLAVQMPRNYEEPSHHILGEVARLPRWRDRVGHRAGWRPVDPPEAYYDRLAPVCTAVDVWETVYFHVLTGPDPVARWVESTAARPYLADLGPDGPAFLAEYADAVRPHYPAHPNGTTLLPFRRLFLVAIR
jgi:trans-aconitate 2-methyltransferase